MGTRTTAIKFTKPEYDALHALAQQRGQTVQKLVRAAVTKTYLRPRKARRKRQHINFAALPAFGIWRDDPRTDDALLNELGAIWNIAP